MVNGFFGLALLSKDEPEKATLILEKINKANAKKRYAFYENFNTNSLEPNGVAHCGWSAAASVLVHQSLYTNFKILV
jgi:hypothetical protein